MEGEITVMEALWTAITTVIGKLITLLGTVCTGLIANELFQIMMGIVLFIVLISIVFFMVKKIKRRG